MGSSLPGVQAGDSSDCTSVQVILLFEDSVVVVGVFVDIVATGDMIEVSSRNSSQPLVANSPAIGYASLTLKSHRMLAPNVVRSF